MKDYTRLKKVIGAHRVDYLADDLCQTTIEMIQTLENITAIKEFEMYKIPITLEKLKERLSLVKDEKKTWYKAKRLDQMNFFLEMDPDGTAWDKLAK